MSYKTGKRIHITKMFERCMNYNKNQYSINIIMPKIKSSTKKVI